MTPAFLRFLFAVYLSILSARVNNLFLLTAERLGEQFVFLYETSRKQSVIWRERRSVGKQSRRFALRELKSIKKPRLVESRGLFVSVSRETGG